MLCSSYHLHHHGQLFYHLPAAAQPISVTTTNSSVLCFCSTNPSTSNDSVQISLSPYSQNPEDSQQQPNSSLSKPRHHREHQLHRRHNSKSTSLLIHHLHKESKPEAQHHHLQEWPSQATYLTEKERAELLEMALVTKKAPQFPGSIYARKAHTSDPSFPPVRTLLGDGEDEGQLLKAIEIRRKVTFEIVVDELRKKGKFGITFATNLASELSGFIDLVMMEAAGLKRLSEFEETSFNFRARRIVMESNMVPLARWLKHNSLSYPQIGRLICMSRGNLGALRNIAEWLKSIYVKERFIGIVLTRVGETIMWRKVEELNEIVGYLECSGIRIDWMGYVVGRCPELLAFTMEEVRTRVEFYTDMGMNGHDFGTMVYDCPKVLGFLSLEEMKYKASYLKEFGLSDEELGKLLAFKPHLMICSIEEKFKPLIKYFYYLGIDRDGLKRILVMKPVVFCIDLEATIAPKVRFLQDIGIRDEAIGNMLVKFPPMLTYSLYKKIRPVVIFLLTKAGVKREDIAKVVAFAPELLGCSIAHKLDGNVKYYLSLGISLQKLGEMVTDFPLLLKYNVELIRPKYRYLRRTMVRPLRDLIEFPRFLSYSLEERIIPRHKVMVENRVNFKLRYMLSGSNEDFNQRVKDAVERRQRFESGVFCSFDSEDALREKSLVPDAVVASTSSIGSESVYSDSQTFDLSSASEDDWSSAGEDDKSSDGEDDWSSSAEDE